MGHAAQHPHWPTPQPALPIQLQLATTMTTAPNVPALVRRSFSLLRNPDEDPPELTWDCIRAQVPDPPRLGRRTRPPAALASVLTVPSSRTRAHARTLPPGR